jgi:predicted nucleic-acid-binding Zn-ribbon protein
LLASLTSNALASKQSPVSSLATTPSVKIIIDLENKTYTVLVCDRLDTNFCGFPVSLAE